jgi:hypothetical protein
MTWRSGRVGRSKACLAVSSAWGWMAAPGPAAAGRPPYPASLLMTTAVLPPTKVRTAPSCLDCASGDPSKADQKEAVKSYAPRTMAATARTVSPHSQEGNTGTRKNASTRCTEHLHRLVKHPDGPKHPDGREFLRAREVRPGIFGDGCSRGCDNIRTGGLQDWHLG